jgi:deoxycytidine triphosphate deaminase
VGFGAARLRVTHPPRNSTLPLGRCVAVTALNESGSYLERISKEENSMLSDTDIKKYLGNGIEIEPFVQTSLSPIGYDFRVGDWAFSLKQRKEYDVKTKGRVVVKPGDTVVIRTLESMRLSCEFGATVHSMVSLLTEGGISHISTTVDPTHTGKLLIQFHNQSVDPVVLCPKRPFCSVCLYNLD